MRINLRTITPWFSGMLLVLFFGYLGYGQYSGNSVAAAERQVQFALAQSQKNETKTAAYYGAKRAEIALAEYRKGVAESRHGCNCGQDVDKYTEGHHAQWCTMFASWVSKQAGSPFVSEKGNDWRLTNSRELAKYLQQHGTWHSREEIIEKHLKPEIGDFVVFWRGDFEDNLGHIDIVASLPDTPGVAGLVGGNLKDRVDYRDFPYEGYGGFLGFGHPEKD